MLVSFQCPKTSPFILPDQPDLRYNTPMYVISLQSLTSSISALDSAMCCSNRVFGVCWSLSTKGGSSAIGLDDNPSPSERISVAKEYVCNKLGLIGSAESVPALAELLADPDLAHVLQSALESMPCPEAAQAIRDRLPNLGGLESVWPQTVT